MTTAIIGVGNLGSALARHLVGGDEPIVLAAKDDSHAVERLSRAAGFDPVKAGGVDAALRIEMRGGDLHQMGLNGELLDLDRAREVLATTEVTA